MSSWPQEDGSLGRQESRDEWARSLSLMVSEAGGHWVGWPGIIIVTYSVLLTMSMLQAPASPRVSWCLMARVWVPSRCVLSASARRRWRPCTNTADRSVRGIKWWAFILVCKQRTVFCLFYHWNLTIMSSTESGVIVNVFQTYPCTQCDFKTTKQAYLKKHIRVKHKSMEQFSWVWYPNFVLEFFSLWKSSSLEIFQL